MKIIFITVLLTLLTAFNLFAKDNNLHRTRSTYRNGYLILTKSDGTTFRIQSPGDLDDDGIADTLEVNGFTFSVNQGLQPWDGDENRIYFRTDPLRWSTDGDPYSDFMEVTGVNMPAGVPAPANHPLVAARPVISVGMTDYDVILISEITNTTGGSESSSFTNTTTNTDQVGGEVTVEASLNPFELVGGEVTASYSHTWTRTESSTSEFGTNWSNTRSTNPSMAARLKLRIFMKNLGSATALNVVPTFNLVLGEKTLATVTSNQSANRLEPKWLANNRYPAEGAIVVERDNSNNQIIVTLEELKAIQSGAPISLVVTQVDADVVRWNSSTQSFDSQIEWNAFESEIDPVVVKLHTNLGDDQQTVYDVYVGTDFNDPGYTFRDVLALVFDISGTEDDLQVEGRKYPDEWYVSSPSQAFIQEWENAGRPQSLLDLKVFRNTKIALMSPGSDPKPRIDFAAYSPDYKIVYLSAFQNNFPISSAKARLRFDGEQKDIELFRGSGRAFYSNAQPFETPAEPGGQVLVENARGDVSQKTISLPSMYTSAADVKNYSNFIPNPGGEFFLFHEGDENKPMLIYCLFFDPISGESLPQPLEYITVPQSGDSLNFVDHRRGGFFSIDNQYKIRIFFDKLRVDLTTLTIDPVDYKFTHIDTFNWYAGDIVPNGSRYGKVSAIPGTDSLFANITLSGTPFHIAEDIDFNLTGNWFSFSDEVTGEHQIDSLRQVVDLVLRAKISQETSYASYGWQGDKLPLEYRASKSPLRIEITSDTHKTAQSFTLHQNYPNPFNPRTVISWQLAVSSNVDLSIYNLLGQKVATLVSVRQPAGYYSYEWDASGLASGVYFYRLMAGEYVDTKKLVMLK